MSRYLITGRTFSSLQKKIAERGDEYFVLLDKATTKFPERKREHTIVADFSNKASIIENCGQISERIDGVIAVYENYILPAAWIAHHLGLLGLPIRAAEACSDKLRMRELFSQVAEKISPAFQIVESKQDLLDFAHTHAYPLMLKPANLAKSLLITKNHSEQELLQNYTKMQQQIPRVYQSYAPHHKPKVLIEEFMHGSIHSVDAFVDHIGTPHVLDAVVDYQTGYDIGYADNFHYSRHLPSSSSLAQTEAIRHTASIGCRALGMRNSAAHVEIILTTDGPRIVEIGARNGGYREQMHRLSNGIDILGAALDITLGKAVVIKSVKNEPCSVLELFPKQPGTFVSLNNEHKLQQLPSLKYLRVKAKPGTFVGSSSDGYKMCAVVVLHNSDPAQFERDLAYVNQYVYVLTNPDSTK